MVKVRVKVVSQRGHCQAGHRPGDEAVFDWENHTIEGRLCLHALYSVLPKVYAMAMGGEVAFARDEEGGRVARHACPDAANPVVLELSLVEP